MDEGNVSELSRKNLCKCETGQSDDLAKKIFLMRNFRLPWDCFCSAYITSNSLIIFKNLNIFQYLLLLLHSNYFSVNSLE